MQQMAARGLHAPSENIRNLTPEQRRERLLQYMDYRAMRDGGNGLMRADMRLNDRLMEQGLPLLDGHSVRPEVRFQENQRPQKYEPMQLLRSLPRSPYDE